MYAYDPIAMSKNDIVYSVLSDVNMIQVNGANNFLYSEYITGLQFNGASEDYIDTTYSNMIDTFGSFIIVGQFGFSRSSEARIGNISLIFDSYLVSTTNRYKVIYNTTGNDTYGYAGYSSIMTPKSLYVGGKTDITTSISLNIKPIDISKYTKEYCNDYDCFCPPGYYFSNYFRTCFRQISKWTAVIIGICIFIFFVLCVIIVGVIIAMSLKKNNKKDEVDEEGRTLIDDSDMSEN